ncbi:Carnosine N-methyltransferase [Sphaceloma murrayae]|uniref:carnosine N-methyltransferase n=1 Tax=Sphaceloma murrayae TaxID=2082308 RepID=A0A2K1QJA1_9PEZI|nr:Carnosine N-methyltransferase [Sphaceloma murrayae]
MSDREINPFDDPEERRVLFAALDSFRQYRRAAHYNITHLRRQSFYALPSAHSDLLSEAPFSLTQTFQAVDDAIDSNADIAEAILALGLETYEIDPDSDEWRGTAKPSDMDKARSSIRQLYRDWSAEGTDERHATFNTMLSALDSTHAAIPQAQRCHISVLVPGAGLGRLVLDVCAAGYSVEGNEISYHQLLVSNWILNHQPAPQTHKLYPWALSFSNHLNRQNQLQKVMIPDVAAGIHLQESATSEIHPFQRMSMSSGDFCVIYKGEEYTNSFHAVLTCFFIDTAPNLIAYIDSIRNCLKPGGVWINMGPLLWHFEGGSNQKKSHKSVAQAMDTDLGIGEAGSFELTNDEVLALLGKCGFDVTHHDNQSHATGYIQDPRSMLQNTYRPSFWMATKR